MEFPQKIGCVLMAAGSARRFGSNKLSVQLEGVTLAEHALNAIPSEEFFRVIVVTRYPEIVEMAKSRGFIVKINQEPDLGLSHTIHIGLEALSDADAILFLVADQPLLRPETILRELELYREHPDFIVSVGFRGRRGNPCIFPKSFFPALFSLEGDMGGNEVIKSNEDKLLFCDVDDERELIDVDVTETLRELAAHRKGDAIEIDNDKIYREK